MTIPPRGVRNNNPGNIRKSATKWQGMSDAQPDPDFVTFKTSQLGVRAMARVLLTYRSAHGCNSVRDVISRWAPASENNTNAYIAAVSAGCGVKPDDPIDVDSAAVMLPLVKAIIQHENGQQPYADAVLSEGLHLAGVADVKAPPVGRQNSFVAQAGSAVALAGAGAVQAAQQAGAFAPTVKAAADKLGAFSGSPTIAHAVTVLLTVAGGLTLVGLVADILKQHRSA